ncbi:DNA methyltransferase [Formosimonas limnophila]|uniref:site-specific DNA-methyltransferase (adenine-specific) n=1 Tax=Formosimonas limnophila TaxID=1384487 RepID=A0A8J3CLW6_9BURK|nr:type ISP restriction/modification enzyme [Formosimonas limnophila]GHA68729.1 DNA methyltransferase [Formosimonas limnophila]
MNTAQYITQLNQRYQLGNATEHTFRGDLQSLIESLLPDIQATNEPKRQKCGAPDYILTRGDIPVGFIEAKDIDDKDLMGEKKTGNKEQFDRYKASLPNLIFTDYLRFILFRHGEFVTEISIAELKSGQITAIPQNIPAFENLLREFATSVSQTITNPKKLAQMMAGKARLLSDVIEKALNSDEEQHDNNSTLKAQLDAFKSILIHDITAKGFADVYAQTICYGMFAARLHDPTLPTFSRHEAAELIPKSNPFLRKLFAYIAGPDLDDRIRWIVDSLIEIFLACNVAEILKDFGKGTGQEDPIIHFYETFLAEYDPALRKARGVWYTPTPVVNFIVRAVDDILKAEFNLPKGLSDHSKTQITLADVTRDKKGKAVDQTIDVHKVQIIDPATGTGTFLAEVIKHIHRPYQGQDGMWSQYVAEHLIPRLNGFELLMASYAMAHLKLDLLLSETGYVKPSNAPDQRLRVFLTNSLEEHHPDTGTLFANWLSSEANEANHIKRDAPVMVVMGNPPYAVSSTNKSDWIQELLADYKRDLNERNIQPLSDDYIKFIRYGQHFIDKNGEGVLAYISNNSFIDGIIHRQMRKSLLESFDAIYILDLHGNAKKKETAPDGSADQNVFDIMQGVSINIFIKTGKKAKGALASVYHHELHGKREVKYRTLTDNNIKSLPWKSLTVKAPEYFFINKDFTVEATYKKGFAVNEMFTLNSSGIKTHRDHFVIDIDRTTLGKRIQKFYDSAFDDAQIASEFKLKDTGAWAIKQARQGEFNAQKICQIAYRPFDNLPIYFDSKLIDRSREKIMHHMIGRENLSLLICRQQSTFDFQHIFISNLISECCSVSLQTKETSYHMPIYLYSEATKQGELNSDAARIPNLNSELIQNFAQYINLTFTPEKTDDAGSFAPIELLDYIYGVLHSPTYRETYKEFLKIDFPRVPYPKNPQTFRQWAALGAQLRALHLLEDTSLDTPITTYPVTGDHVVDKPIFVADTDNPAVGKVLINATQYFGQVPRAAWEFYIGGYQPAQKWLKDRKGRSLSFDDIMHYQKIIQAQMKTHALMATAADWTW